MKGKEQSNSNEATMFIKVSSHRPVCGQKTTETDISPEILTVTYKEGFFWIHIHINCFGV